VNRFFPKREEIWQVYGLVAAIVYLWMLVAFFYHFPSYILFMSLWDIFGAFSYAAVGAFLESLFILCVLLGVGALFRPVRENFISYGGLIAILWDGWILLLSSLAALIFEGRPISWQIWLGVAILPGLLSVALIWRAPRFQRLLASLADRVIVLLVLFLPASGIGLLVILARLAMSLWGRS
jgi:hypothetical protein